MNEQNTLNTFKKYNSKSVEAALLDLTHHYNSY